MRKRVELCGQQMKQRIRLQTGPRMPNAVEIKDKSNDNGTELID